MIDGVTVGSGRNEGECVGCWIIREQSTTTKVVLVFIQIQMLTFSFLFLGNNIGIISIITKCKK